MGRGPEQTSLPKRHTTGHYIYEKMLNHPTSLAIRKMKKKTTMRCHLTPVRMAIITKWKITSAGEVVEKKEHSFTAGGN